MDKYKTEIKDTPADGGTTENSRADKPIKRTLYECSHARVHKYRVICEKGYTISEKDIEIRHLAKGQPLAMTTCQTCEYFDRMGPPVPKNERGWEKQKG
jgi:hypothetical protein